MTDNEFEQKFNAFVKSLKCARVTSFIELDREKELAYLQANKYRFKNTFQSIPPGKPIRILDIGTTPFSLFIKDSYPDYTVATLDLTNLMEDRCMAKGIQFKVCDLASQQIPFEDNFFDLVIFTEVLEHILAPPSEVIREIRRVMRPGGKLIITVPNLACLANRLKLLFGISPFASSDSQMQSGWVHGYGHLREYTMKEMASILEGCDLVISEKSFLQLSLSDIIRRPDSKANLLVPAYYLVTLLVPSLRGIISIKCYKTK